MLSELAIKLASIFSFWLFFCLPCYSAISTNIPNKSLIVIDGGGGCLAYEYYNYTILHHGKCVIAKSQTGFDKKIRYFELSHESYISFLQKYFEMKDSLVDSYGFGELHSTGDWIMSLTIEYADGSKIRSKEIGYVMGRVEDKQFLSLLKHLSTVTTNTNECTTFEAEDWNKTRPTIGWSLPSVTPVD